MHCHWIARETCTTASLYPAAYETITEPICQEIPRTFDMVYAKSRSYQERPGMGRWSADDESRAFQLTCSIPAEDLGSFWRAIVTKANQVRIQTRRGDPAAYFQNPRLVIQAHDLKNTFSRRTMQEALSHFEETILAYVNPELLDLRSSWVDIGTRDYVATISSRGLRRSDHLTLLWKRQCNRRLHEGVLDAAPDSSLTPTFFRSFLLRDVGQLTKKIRPPNLGHPASGKTGVVRVKAYLQRVVHDDWLL